MVQEKKSISLNGKMYDWGPYGKNEGKWLIFSIGNPEEGHGYALPRNIDDLFSQRVAYLVSCKSGGRYVAHIPWATDNFEAVAIDWAPKFIPLKQLVEKIKKFLKYHIEIYKEMGLPASRVLIYSGHGGNNPLTNYTDEIRKELNLEKLIISTTEGIAEKNMDIILIALDKLSRQLTEKEGDARKMKRILIKILTGIGHADHFEHSVGATLGVLDEKKLKIMNAELEKDFEKALEKWPPLAGLGGYLLAGGKYIEAIGTKDNDKHGLWNCLKTMRTLDGGKIKPIKELGELVINLLSDYYAQLLLEE